MDVKFNPESQLTKHGWKTGAGLGRGEDGIKEAVKVKLKFDQTGVGHNVADQFTFHWWDHVFNKAANNISVADSGSEVKLSSGGDCVISNKKNLPKTNKKDMLYGSFVKASTLSNGVEVKSKMTSDDKSNSDSSSESDSEDDDIGTASKMTDEQLMKVCGGRTAHKAARHGLGLNGKLARVAQQEELYTTNTPENSSPSSPHPASTEPHSPEPHTSEGKDSHTKKKKKKSKKNAKDLPLPIEESTNRRKKRKKDLSVDSEAAEIEHCSKRQKKSKKKSKCEKNYDCDNELESAVYEESHCIDIKTKKKKKKKKRNE